MKSTTALVAVALSATLALASCSSSDDGATTTTKAKTTTTKAGDATPASRKATCGAIQAAFADYQPHMDDIFANGNDDPTMAEWAAFLPKQIDDLDAMISRVQAVDVPADDPELAEAFDAAIGDFQAMSDLWSDSLDAAKADDEAAMKAAEDDNQNEVTPKLQEDTGKVGELCGFPQS